MRNRLPIFLFQVWLCNRLLRCVGDGSLQTENFSSFPPKMSPKGATFWRKAGLNYLQYLTIATRAVRAGMKVSSSANWSVDFWHLFASSPRQRRICSYKYRKLIAILHLFVGASSPQRGLPRGLLLQQNHRLRGRQEWVFLLIYFQPQAWIYSSLPCIFSFHSSRDFFPPQVISRWIVQNRSALQWPKYCFPVKSHLNQANLVLLCLLFGFIRAPFCAHVLPSTVVFFIVFTARGCLDWTRTVQ